MKYERFEQLPVWQAAMRVAEGVYALTDRRAFRGVRELRDQVRRAALSVSNNIAEGFERGTTAELLNFLYIARGSAGEVRSMLIFCERLIERGSLRPGGRPSESEISDLKSQISDLKSEIVRLKGLAESCSRQLRAWADHLQNSDIEGPRRLTDKTRRSRERKQTAAAFQQHLQDIIDDAQEQRAKKEPEP